MSPLHRLSRSPRLMGALRHPLSRMDKLLLAGGAVVTALIGILAGAGWLA